MDSHFNPWLEIWIRPKATIRRIIQENPNRSLWLLSAIYGFVSLLNDAQALALGLKFSALAIFLIAVILSPLWGYAFLSFWSLVVYWTGKWFKGIGHFQTIRAAYAWSCVPVIINVLSWLVLAAFFRSRLFLINSGNSEISEALVYFLFFIFILRLIVAVWSLVIYLNALAEVQKYSVLKAIFNVIVTSLLMIPVFALISFIWELAKHIFNPAN